MRLLAKLSVVAKQRGMAESTIACYSLWVKQFLRFSATAHAKWVHPSELGTSDVEAFLNDMVTTRQLAGSTQNQALNALVFLYKHVLDAIPSDHLGKFLLQRSKRPKRVPTVLSVSEVARVIEAVPGAASAWAQSTKDNDDLHPCNEQTVHQRGQPAGPRADAADSLVTSSKMF